MERVFSISEGKDPDLVQCIDPFELHKKFEDKFPEVLSINCLTRDYGLHRVLHTALILRSEGITKEKVGHFYVCIIIFLTICYWTSVSDTICWNTPKISYLALGYGEVWPIFNRVELLKNYTPSDYLRREVCQMSILPLLASETIPFLLFSVLWGQDLAATASPPFIPSPCQAREVKEALVATSRMEMAYNGRWGGTSEIVVRGGGHRWAWWGRPGGQWWQKVWVTSSTFWPFRSYRYSQMGCICSAYCSKFLFKIDVQ